MGSLGATRVARSRAHVGAAAAAALIVFVLVGLLTATQARSSRAPTAWPARSVHTAVPTPARPTDVLVARSSLRADVDETADSPDDGSSDAVLPVAVASLRTWSSSFTTPPIASDPISSVWWAATAARAPPDTNATAFSYLPPIG
jgi:hypothetical protein